MVETLDSRQLLSGITATLSMPSSVLEIRGTSSDETIHVTDSNNSISVDGVTMTVNWDFGTWKTSYQTSNVPDSYVGKVMVYCGNGNDKVRFDPSVRASAVVYAGAGNDTIVGGSGSNYFYGGAGIDTLISVGGGPSYLCSGTGQTSFWVDSNSQYVGATSAEIAAGMVHHINKFDPLVFMTPSWTSYSQPSLVLDGQSIPDPVINVAGSRMQNYRSNPLFASDGPTPSDVAEGQTGTCTFLSGLMGIAANDPNRLRQMIVDLGDGTYAVNFKPNGVDHYLRIDADLPTNADGTLTYAKLGHQNSLWVSLLEKAWCFERPTDASWSSTRQGSYAMIDGGGTNELYSMFNISFDTLSSVAQIGGSAFWDQVVNAYTAGKVVTIGTNPTLFNSGLVASHCYLVDHLNYSYVLTGSYYTRVISSITLRNPWGGTNPFVTIHYIDLVNDFYGGWSALV